MRSRIITLSLAFALAMALCLPMAASAATKVTTVVPPVVTLDRVEVQNYFGFWHGTKEKPKAKGNAPLVVAFVFNISNANSLPVMLDNFKFTYAFDGYDIRTPIFANYQWIPAGKTNQLRVVSTMTTGALAGNLAVTAGFQMKEKGDSAGALLKKWWTTIPDYAFPIAIKYGTAMFVYDGGEVISTFVGEFGGK